MTDTLNHIVSTPTPAETGNAMYDLILRRIKLLSFRRIAWLRKLWTEAQARNTGNKLFNHHAEVDGCLNILDVPERENDWYSKESGIQTWNAELKEVEQKLKDDKEARLEKLSQLFGLTEMEKDVVQACLALSLEPNLGRVYAYLQDHNGRSYVTRQLVARLFHHSRFLPLGPSSPLFAWRIISETDNGRGEPGRLDCDDFIRNWLLGSNDIDGVLADIANVQPVFSPLQHWPVQDIAASVATLLKRKQNVRLFIAGAEGSGKHSFAAAVCRQLKLPLLSIQANRASIPQWHTLFMQAQRQALIRNCALLWEGSITHENHWYTNTAVFPLQFVIGETNESLLPNEEFTDIRFEMPSIPVEEVARLMRKLIPVSSNWPQDELMQVIKRQRCNIGLLAAVSKKEITTTVDLSEALRSLSRQKLGNLAQLINSSFSWDDLVLPDMIRNLLDDFYFEAGERAMVWENPAIKKYFPQGRGLMALFTGAPGTGKTMAAQVIANRLQLDLFRIDLSAVVSKYVGETSKNVERILSKAAGMNAILLFDEADSLFGKRTEIKDAHDRFANTDTNYLLQAIEEYPGIAILASNRKANIDSGFTRRLRFVIDFPKPDAQHRLQLWQRLLAELTGIENAKALHDDISRIAELLEVTGAQIKQAILSAIFMSRREKKNITITHLLRGMERELMKENRGIGRQVQEMMKG